MERSVPHEKIVKLIDLDCANCAAKIENAIQKIDGVEKASVSFMTQKMTIEAPEGRMDAILQEAKKLIHKLEPDVTVQL